ncbi:hypothetical protein F5Y18DRAFT_401549 [Xylariaceae sp. FL1019]|nr:hypothetical protein F5Y18DRAFT_401549 [Xylariaceae sp. FL1019]
MAPVVRPNQRLVVRKFDVKPGTRLPTIPRLALTKPQPTRPGDQYQISPAAATRSDVRSEAGPLSKNIPPHLQGVCEEHGFAMPSTMTAVRHTQALRDKPWKVWLSISHKHCFNPRHKNYLEELEHPWTKSQMDMYIDKSKEPLWLWGFFSGAGACAVRKSEKAMKQAFRWAMAQKGYDRYGTQTNHKGVVTGIMYGTLQISCNTPCALYKEKTLRPIARDILEAIEPMLQKRVDRPHLSVVPDGLNMHDLRTRSAIFQANSAIRNVTDSEGKALFPTQLQQPKAVWMPRGASAVLLPPPVPLSKRGGKAVSGTPTGKAIPKYGIAAKLRQSKAIEKANRRGREGFKNDWPTSFDKWNHPLKKLQTAATIPIPVPMPGLGKVYAQVPMSIASLLQQKHNQDKQSEERQTREQLNMANWD